MRWIRVFDWRLPFSVALLILVVFLVANGQAVRDDNEAKGRRVDVLIAELGRVQSDAARDRAVAASERAEMRAAVDVLSDQYADLARRHGLLLDHLRTHNIDVPVQVVESRATVLVPRTRPRVVTPERPARTTAPPPVVDEPGKSDGKRHRGKGHRR